LIHIKDRLFNQVADPKAWIFRSL